ncbi:MAG: hypothetical protein MN733_39090 [Nitrososphaera sp.]|nr:hypothetical protein [Nitrososphaera sp.]
MAATLSVKRKRSGTKRIGEILFERGGINQQELGQALEYQQAYGGRLGSVMKKLGLMNESEWEEVVILALSSQYGVPYLPLENFEIDWEVVQLIPEHVAQQYCLMPIDRISNGLTVAIADLDNPEAIEAVKVITGCHVQVILSPRSKILSAIQRYYESCGKK